MWEIKSYKLDNYVNIEGVVQQLLGRITLQQYFLQKK